MAELTLEQKKALAIADAQLALQGQSDAESPLRGYRNNEAVRLPLSDFPKALRGAGEGLVNMIGKAAGGVLGGAAGFGAAINPGTGQFEPRSVDILNNVSGTVSGWIPPWKMSREGELSAEAMSFPFMAAERGADRIGEAAPGGAGVQTAVKTGILGLPAFLGPAKQVAKNIPRSRLVDRGPLNLQQRTLLEAQEAGYAVPTSTAVPDSPVRGKLEGIVGGKPRLEQEASFNNQRVTNNLAAIDLGLPMGSEITLASLKKIRNEAGQAYSVLENAGTITANAQFRRDLSNAVSDLKSATRDWPVLRRKESAVAEVLDIAKGLNTPTFQASSVVQATKLLRDEASKAFSSGDASVGRAYRGLSKALEDAAEAHLVKFGDPVAVQNFQAARQRIAKTYSVQEALSGDGWISATNLAKQRQDGIPLTGNLDLAARFAEQFPKNAKLSKEAPINQGRLVAPIGGAGGGLLWDTHPALAAAIWTATFGGPLLRAGVLTKPGQSMFAAPKGQLIGGGTTAGGLLESAILADEAKQQ